jgi:hypothetical protein
MNQERRHMDFEAFRRQQEGREAPPAPPQTEAATVAMPQARGEHQAPFLCLHTGEGEFVALPYPCIQRIYGTNFNRSEQSIFIASGRDAGRITGHDLTQLLHKLLNCQLGSVQPGRDGVTEVQWGMAQEEKSGEKESHRANSQKIWQSSQN